MAERLALRFQRLEDEVHQPSEVLEGAVVQQAFPVGLVPEVGIRVARYLDESDDLVVAQPDDGIVDAPLIEAQPVVVRLAVGPDPEAIAVDADPRPLAQPGAHLCARSDPRERLRLQVEPEDPHPEGPAVKLPAAIPRVRDDP